MIHWNFDDAQIIDSRNKIPSYESLLLSTDGKA